ncbi:MAG: hypothetical protein CUN54_10655, partial [Phototrophicales bacterium]
GVGAADGLDFTYGAGLTVLGDPTYDLSQVTNLGAVSSGNPLGGSDIYVGLGDLDSQQTGSAAEPFTSIAHALALASANDRIIINPGEYVSSFGIDNSIVADY